MASLVKCLSGKQEEQSSIPSKHIKAYTVVPTFGAGEQEAGSYPGVAGQARLSKSVSSRFNEI